MAPVNIGLVGIGGFGGAHLSCIEALEKEGTARLHVVVIRNRQKYAKDLAGLEARGVLIRSSLEEMLAEDTAACGFMAIPTGIAEHHDMLIQCLEAGNNVYLEKPATATIQEMDEMLAAVERTGHWCQVGYQSQSKYTVMELKKAIVTGKLGAIRDVAVYGYEFRRDNYYTRNSWAGVLKDDQGRWVLDGPINNPFSHQVMNALYFACQEWGKTAAPKTIRAELYRAHDIESEDTSCFRIETVDGTRIFYCVTLAGTENRKVKIEIAGDKGSAVWVSSGDVEIKYKDGASETIKEPKDNYLVGHFRNAVQFQAGAVKELDCPLAMARNVVLATDGCFLSGGVPRAIPKEYLHIYQDEKANSRAIEIKEIDNTMNLAFTRRELFSEVGAPWAAGTKTVALGRLKKFTL